MFKKEREIIIEIGRNLYLNRYISGSEGNISMRVEENMILATPSGKNKGFLQPDDLVLIDQTGKHIRGDRKVSTEILMHLEYYRQRSDVHAVIHCHPKNCIALMLAGISLNRPYLPEMVVILGSIPTAPYATPSTDEVPKSISDLVTRTDVIMLDHHGVVVGSEDMEIAYLKLETLEHAAESIVKAYLLRNRAPRALGEKEVKRLLELRRTRYKIPGKFLDDYQFS